MILNHLRLAGARWLLCRSAIARRELVGISGVESAPGTFLSAHQEMKSITWVAIQAI